jgi:CubicO group peptidase (beta-lactamase class C family)
VTAPTNAAEAGIDPARLEVLLARVRRDVEDGTLECAQVALARNNQLVAFESYGEATQGGALKPVTSETLFTVFSSTKAIVAAAVWKLLEDGKVRLDERVAEIVPEFGTNGKDVITVEQVLLHLGGFPRGRMGPRDWSTSEGRRAAFARWVPDYPAGEVFEYHATAGHWVLAEIIETRTGQDFRAYVTETVLSRAGVDDFWLGLPEAMHGRIADVRWMGEPVPPPGGWREVTPEAVLAVNTVSARSVGIPGGGGIGTARGLAMFYQPLANGGLAGNGNRIMKAETIDWATQVRTGPQHLDLLTQVPTNRGLSIVVAGDDGNRVTRGFGEGCSPRAFGHLGAGGQIGWGDPETGLSLGYCTSGFVGDLAWRARCAEISTLAAATVR